MNRLLMLAIAIVVIAIAGIAITLLSGEVDMEARAHDILADLSAGRHEAVWNASSAEFRARYPLPRFRSIMADFHGTMGAFRRIVAAAAPGAGPDESIDTSTDTSTDGLSFELEYANGKAFCYIVLDGEQAPPRLQDLLLRKMS